MTSVTLEFFTGSRGRRKQAKPQRKNVELEEGQTNSGNPCNTDGKHEEDLKMHEAVMCKRIDSEDEDDDDYLLVVANDSGNENGNGNGNCNLPVKLNGNSLNTEVPNVRETQTKENPNRKLNGVPKLNGQIKTVPPAINGAFGKHAETNGSRQLGLFRGFEKPRKNGEIAPSLRDESKRPLIVVKTAKDLNQICKKNGERKLPERKDARTEEEEEKIREYLKRGDTAVIYQEPVDHKAKVPLSPATVKALTEADISNPDYFIKCLHCQKAYPGLQALRDHIESEHIGNLSPNEALSPVQGSYSPVPVPVLGGHHACSQCSVSFSSKDQLVKHELLHSPNAQVSCKVCNKQFANVYRLQRHMISHDESAVLRKFKCPECEKAFKFKHHLKEHIRIHSGEKPFECANCGKRFSHSGSYSSHMTSKKCLVMNLKVNRGRGVGLDKTQISRNLGAGSKRSITNNNNINSLKGNLNLNGTNISLPSNASFPGLLPKYGDATAAFFSAAAAPRSNFPSPSAPGLHPFYMATAPTMHLNNTAMRAYGIPALSHFLEQFATPSSLLLSPKKESEDLKEDKQEEESREEEEEDEEVKKEDVKPKEETDDNDEAKGAKEVKVERTEDDKETRETGSPVRNCGGGGGGGGDLEAVKRILETVNATVTKQFLHANMQKFTSSPSGSSCASAPSPTGDESQKAEGSENIECRHCGKIFQNRIDQHQHERYLCENLQKSEGLAAKLEEVASGKSEDNLCGSGSEDEDAKEECEEEIERNEDGGITITTTTQEGGADGRKVRVRSLIADEQLAVLKHHYLINPRPKREELAKIADKIGFPVRVVQVWFQNTRARDRREGRLVQVPYLPIPSLFPSNVPLLHPNLAEQPLDLSVKKSLTSSPETSPQRNSNSSGSSRREFDALNLSRKSTSPSPQTFANGLTIRAMSGFPQYQHSSCTSSLGDFRKTPSPLAYLNLHQEDLKSNSSKLARILAKPSPHGQRALDANGVSLVSKDRLSAVVFNSDLQNSASPLPVVALSLLKQENGRACSSSPGSDKRSWGQGDLTDETEDSRTHDAEHGEDFISRSKKAKFQQESHSDPEAEGQFICDQCDKAFSKQSSLARHKYEHSGQRPHKCEVCEKAFKHKHHLTEHKRLHSGEKPFQCGKCLKRFSHSGSYSQHMNHRYSYCKPYRD